MKKDIFLIIILSMLVPQITPQNDQLTQVLTFGKTIEVILDVATPRYYTVTIPTGSKASNLYIRAEPKYSDPLEVPYLTITSGKQYTLHCYNADIQFAGVCKVPAVELKSQRQFKLEVKCASTCDLQIQAYLNDFPNLPIESDLSLSAFQQAGLTEMIEVAIPNDINYTSLAVIAVVLNYEENVFAIQEGLDLLINVGDSSIKYPDEQQFQLKGKSFYGGGKEIILTKQNAPPGSVIKAYLKLKKGISASFKISKHNGNQSSISLGRSYLDVSDKQINKIYTLDTASKKDVISQKTIQIVFDVYSGNPKVTIGFDINFDSNILIQKSGSAISILLSPQLRLNKKFARYIYIKVQTLQSAQYYFYTHFIREDVTYIQPYISYVDEIKKGAVENYLLVEKFKYPQGQNNTIKNHTFKIDISSGNGSFYFKRCQTLESIAANNPSMASCLVRDSQTFKTQDFYKQQIQNKLVSLGKISIISMEFDIQKCTEVKRADGFVHAKCAFQIMGVGQTTDIFSFALLVERKYTINYLKEGKLTKQYIPKNNYVYYAFGLPDPESVEEVNIFLTTLSGDSALIVSSAQPFPSLSSNNTIKQSGSKNNIILKKEKITKNIYISVYAYQFTEINIGVIVNRKGSNNSVHEIPLEEDNIQTYNINKTQPIVKFRVQPINAKQITVLLNEIKGHVSMKIYDLSNKSTKQCVDQHKDSYSCKFGVQQNKIYTIEVYSKDAQPSKFSITYKTNNNQCFQGNLNVPLYVTLAPKQKKCFYFNINRDIPIVFTSALSHIQLINKEITTHLSINRLQIKQLQNNHYTVSIQDMHSRCPMGLKRAGFNNPCQISITFLSNSNETDNFNFIMEEQDSQIALFDGINEKVRGTLSYSGDGKNFYYHLSSQKLLQIFFSTQSLKSNYFLAAKFISKQAFLNRNLPGKQIFLNYIPSNERPSKQKNLKDNYYWTVLDKTGLSTISIAGTYIKKYCQPTTDCYLILSIYIDNLEDDSTKEESDYYEVQITQQQTFLEVGGSKLGYLDKGQVYTYLVDPIDGMIEFRIINSRAPSICLVATAATADGTIIKKNMLKNNLQVEKIDNIEKIYVKGQSENCQYEIRYISIKNPYHIVRLSHPYQLNLEKGKIQKFIYYHQNPLSFKVVQMASAGKVKIYIKPIKQQNLTLSSLQDIPLSSYPIIDVYDGQYNVDSKNNYFCSNCYYYILVTTQQKFIGQLVFLRLYDPVPLTVNHIFKESLVPMTELGVQNYIYYSLTSFFITFNVLSGKTKLAIINPEGIMVVDQIIYEEKTFHIKAIEYEEKQTIQFYSERTKYKIRTQAIDETELTIKIDRSNVSERIFEGYPSKILLQSVHSKTIEFVNSQDLSRPLNVMVDVDEQGKQEASLTFTYTAQNENGESIPSNNVLIDIIKSDNTYITSLKNIRGRYFINIVTNINVNITLLIVKSDLNHLSPLTNHLFNSDGVYQLSSGFKKIMVEVFACKGEITMLASKDINQLNSQNITESPIDIKRPNYGGHYVFGVQTHFSSYFIKIQSNVKGSPLEYLIKYYYYEDKNPYEIIDAENYEISYQNLNGSLGFSVKEPKINQNLKSDGSITIDKIQYWIYASSIKQDLNRYSRCEIEGRVIEKASLDSNQMVLDNSLLAEVIKSNGTEKLFVSIEASIYIRYKMAVGDAKFAKVLTILYNTIEVPVTGWNTEIQYVEQSYKYWFTNNLAILIGWMMLPFVLAATTLYYILKYCMSKLMRSQKEMVEEVDIVPAPNKTVGTEGVINQHQQSGPIPNSGVPMMKEHI